MIRRLDGPVAVLGLGQIGGSVARSLMEAYEVTGYDPDPETRELATEADIPVTGDLRAAVRDAAVVVVAAPLEAMTRVLRDLAGTDATVTDVASVKSPVLTAARAAGLAGFVGGHPMAGSEISGFAASRADLFTDASWMLGVERDTDIDRWTVVADLVTQLGARVVPATAVDHDAAVARTSHLPHLIAAALATVVGAEGKLTLTLAGGSFRDATRVAASAPGLATAMCALNHDALEAAVADFVAVLESADRTTLIDTGHAVRRVWPPRPLAWTHLPVDGPDPAGQLIALGRRGGWVEAVGPDRLAVRDPG